MLLFSFYEFLLRAIPESFIINYGIFFFIRKRVMEFHEYFILSLFSAIMVCFIRYLPISFGVHIFINVIITVGVMRVLGLTLSESIYSTFIMYLLLSFSEFINILILDLFSINMYSNNELITILLGIPSLIITILFVGLIKFILKKKGFYNIYDW